MTVIQPHHLDIPILIADTDAAEAARMEGMLRTVGHRHIRTTGDLREVTGLHRKWPFGLLIIHVADAEALQTIASTKDAITPHAPAILAVLDNDDRSARDRVLSVGARDFITRPHSWPELTSRVRNMLDIWHLESERAQTL